MYIKCKIFFNLEKKISKTGLNKFVKILNVIYYINNTVAYALSSQYISVTKHLQILSERVQRIIPNNFVLIVNSYGTWYIMIQHSMFMVTV